MFWVKNVKYFSTAKKHLIMKAMFIMHLIKSIEIWMSLLWWCWSIDSSRWVFKVLCQTWKSNFVVILMEFYYSLLPHKNYWWGLILFVNSNAALRLIKPTWNECFAKCCTFNHGLLWCKRLINLIIIIEGMIFQQNSKKWTTP